MIESLSASNLNPNIEDPLADKSIAVIFIFIFFCGGILLTFLSFQQTHQDYQIVYAERRPTENSKLVYGNSGAFELEPFSGKTLQAYQVPYGSRKVQNFHFGEFVLGILMTAGVLIFWNKNYESTNIKAEINN